MTLINFIFDTAANIVTWIGGNPWKALFIFIAIIAIMVIFKRIID